MSGKISASFNQIHCFTWPKDIRILFWIDPRWEEDAREGGRQLVLQLTAASQVPGTGPGRRDTVLKLAPLTGLLGRDHRASRWPGNGHPRCCWASPGAVEGGRSKTPGQGPLCADISAQE